MRSGLLARVLAPVVVLVAVLALSADAERRDAPQAVLTASAGGVTIANSLDGSAIFTASNIGPGDTTSGTVTIRNTGTVWGLLDLRNLAVTDAPGPGGGLLSQRMWLYVYDVTGPAASRIYAGPLASLSARRAGLLAPNQLRRYRFVAFLPHGGADNAFAAGSVSASYRWTASAAAAPSHSDTRAPHCSFSAKRGQRVVRSRRLRVGVVCDENARLRVWAFARSRRGSRRFLSAPRGLTVRADRRRAVVLVVPWAPRRIVASRRRPSLRLAGTASDAAGNQGAAAGRVAVSRR